MPRSTRWRQGISRATLVALVALTAGCGGAAYSWKLHEASRRFEQARQLRADQLAPYEYYFAKEHYDEARHEAAEADYGDAIRFADRSREYFARAIERAKAKAKASEERSP